MKKLHWIAALLFFGCFPLGAAERMTVALLNPRNASGDINAAYWQYAISLLMDSELREVKSIRLLPDSSINYAFRQLKLKGGEPLSPDQARKLGEIIEARRVVWSQYSQEGQKHSLTMWVVNVANGKASKKLIASGPDWFQVVSNSVANILHEVDVVPTPDEEARMNRTLTRSTEALQLLAQAEAKNKTNGPLPEIEPLLRKAALIDPAFVSPVLALAEALLMDRDTPDEAEEIAGQAVNIRPDSASAHFVLGMVYEFKGLNYVARDELLQAIRLYPDDPDNYDRLGEIYSRMGRTDAAMAAWKQAAVLAPYDAEAYACLGLAYALEGNRDQAIEELRIAEHFNAGDDVGSEEKLADAYMRLKDAPHYVEHAEKFLVAARQAGIQNQVIKDTETDLVRRKESLTPHFITAKAPRDYSPMELDNALKARLTPAEFQSVTNPLSSTVGMKQWAEELTAGATGEHQRARLLFAGLTHHLDVGNTIGKRTAEQSFQIWKEHDVDLTCMDYAFLYVSLARDVGLKAYFTVINKDWTGTLVPHVCACVFVDGKALLVDPVYNWFGVPHQDFQIQNDFQMTAFFLSQMADVDDRRLAVKLCPDFALGHFNLAMALAGLKQLEEARKELTAGLALDPSLPVALMAQGAVEANSQDLSAAAAHFQQCVDLEPGLYDARFGLAVVLRAQGKQLEAREQFRKYLQGLTEPEKAEVARKAIAVVDEDSADSTLQTASTRFHLGQDAK